MLIEPASHFVEVDVCDHPISGLKQRAKWTGFGLDQNPSTGKIAVSIRLITVLYANENGAYGAAVPEGKGIVYRPVPLFGNDDTAVDPLTGAICYLRGSETEADWLAMLRDKPEPLMLQGAWVQNLFFSQADNNFPDLLYNFIEKANLPPFNKFS